MFLAQRKHKELSALFSGLSSFRVLSIVQFRRFKSQAVPITKEQFYDRRFNVSAIQGTVLIERVPKPVGFVAENEKYFRGVFSIRKK